MTIKIPIPREFLEELNLLLRALGEQKHAGELNRQTLDGVAKVCSWLPHFQPVSSLKFKEQAAQ